MPKVAAQKLATRSGRPTESRAFPKADRPVGSTKFEGGPLPDKNLPHESGTPEGTPSTPLSKVQEEAARSCRFATTCKRTDAHTHTGAVLKAYARRAREKANAVKAGKSEKKEKDPRDLRWHMCHLPPSVCPNMDKHGHLDWFAKGNFVELADMEDLVGKDGEEACRIWEQFSDAPLVPYTGPFATDGGPDGIYRPHPSPSRPPWTGGCANHDHSQCHHAVEEMKYNPIDGAEIPAARMPPIAECADEDAEEVLVPLLHETKGTPRDSEWKEMSMALAMRSWPVLAAEPAEVVIHPMEKKKNLSKHLLPASAEKERALEVLGESPPIPPKSNKSGAGSTHVGPEVAVNLTRTTQVFIFSDNDGAQVTKASRSRWHKVREYLALNTFLVSKKAINVANKPGKYTLAEVRSEIDKDISSYKWFWQAKKKRTPETLRQELNDFGRRYTHIREAAVYSELVEYVLQDRAFMARGSSLLRDGVVSQVTLLLIDRLLSLHPHAQIFLEDTCKWMDTKCHLVNQVHLRGLRAESMKVKVPGKATLVDFRKRARTMDVSPHAPSSKPKPSTRL